SEFRWPTAAARVVAVAAKDQDVGMSTSGTGQNLDYAIRWDGMQPKKTAVLIMYDSPARVPVSFQVVDDAGAAHTNLSSSGGDVSMHEFDIPPERVARIRAKYLPLLDRLIIELPGMPGLPEANRGIEDLMQVRIPYLRVKDEYEWVLLASLLQLDVWPYRDGAIADWPAIRVPRSYPMEFRNATVAEILAGFES